MTPSTMTGYEKAPGYGGPPFHWREMVWLVAAVVIGAWLLLHVFG